MATKTLIRNRPSRHEMFMAFARIAASRSVCGRRVQVGCVVTNRSGTNVDAIGYNGPARGLAHDCGGIPDPPPGSSLKCSCVHAEANAIIKSTYGPDLILYTTLSPCAECARLILNSTITTVIFETTYRDHEGIRILVSSGIEVFRFDEGVLCPMI